MKVSKLHKLNVYYEGLFSTLSIHRDKTQTYRKYSLDKIRVTKKALFSLSRTPTHHNCIFNPRLLYELRHKVFLIKFFV